MAEMLTTISPASPRENAQVDALLEAEGIRRDGNLDYTCGVFDDEWNLIATGSCFHNTLRCLAVARDHQGEGLLGLVIGHLVEVQMQRGNAHLFLYTKPEAAKFMADLGFFEIARVPGKLVFMENRPRGFQRYLESLARAEGGAVSAIVMNANPFTLGHRHLVETAARESDVLHLFVLSEESGPIPSSVRKRLVQEGVADLKNVIVHDSGPYLISSATFPSYFLKDSDAAIRAQAELDLLVFSKIARTLGIQRRYVGEEPASHVTALYNEIMMKKLPELGIDCVQIPRLEAGGQPISASTVRKRIQDGLEIRSLVPESTCRYFLGEESASVREAIRNSGDVSHY